MSIPSSPIVQAETGRELDFGPEGNYSVKLTDKQTAGALTFGGHVSFFTDGHRTAVRTGG